MKPLTFTRASKIAWQSRWRAVATAMLPIYFFTSLPPGALASTGSQAPDFPAPVLTPKNVHVNKTRPAIQPYAGVQLSAQPTDQEFTYSHAFQEPLLPLTGKTTSAENKALAKAIKTYLQRKEDEDVSALVEFLTAQPNSAWRPSLDLNLAEVYYRTGNFTSALDAWQDAWDRTQNLTDEMGQQVANLAVAKLAKMKARIGRTDELDALLKQTKGRSMTGPAAQIMVNTRNGLWLMQNKPQDAFRCGPAALQELSMATKHKVEHPEIIKKSRSTGKGMALADIQELSNQINMPMQMAKRSPGAPFVFPAVIHWKLGHYAALTGQQDGKYIVHDTTFGATHFLVSAQALERETSGYYLIPAGKIPAGWTAVDTKEGHTVFGRGHTGLQYELCFGPDSVNSGNDCGSAGSSPLFDPLDQDAKGPDGNNKGDTGSSQSTSTTDPNATNYANVDGMTTASVKAMLVSLTLVDTPISYTPPVGPAMHFTVEYNQREITEPTIFTTPNLGPNWSFSYHSYVTPGVVNATVFERGGGFTNYYLDPIKNNFYPAQGQRTVAILSKVNSTTWQRVLAGGEIETYGQPDGGGNFFLTKLTDPLGNSLSIFYDGALRISYLVDALGQVTNVFYRTSGDIYKIVQVVDPFGRAANFFYDASGRLTQITDTIGVTSQFAYQLPLYPGGNNTFIKSLTTPYGVTSFAFGDNSVDPSLGTTRWEETTFPDGNKNRTEYNQGAPGIANSDPQGVPAGMYPGITATNDYMQYRNTYYWDKQATKHYPGDYAHAQVTHWLHTSDINTTSDTEESLKKPSQNRIWYGYSGEISSIQASDSMISQPTQKGRILDDGTSQVFTYKYNPLGKVTQEIDPMGRETDYDYATNNIDVLTVRQKNGAGFDTLSTTTYNSQHEPLTITDASGQTTTNTYYPNGQLHTTTNAKGQTTTNAYDASGYLTSVTGPVAGATMSFTYDSYGRVRTTTDSQGYTTTTDYDLADRPTRVTYPDSTITQLTYLYLDLQYSRDRLGRTTHSFYDSMRRLVSVQDALGHTTTTNYTPTGQVSSIVDSNGNTTSWKYDSQNRPIEKDYTDGQKILTTYENTTSRVKTVTDAKGQVATTSYNIDNTVSQVAYTNAAVATPTVSFVYDAVYPRVHTMTDGTGTTTYNYNVVTGTLGSGKPSSVQTPLATTTYTSYDELGRLLSQAVDGVASSMTYDTLGRVQTTTNALGSSAFAYTYLGNTGRVASITNPNGQSTVYTYQDSATTGEPRLSEIKNLNASAAVISKFNYLYDAQGQITTWTQQTATNDPAKYALKYDAGGRLLSANVTDTVTGAMLHDYDYIYDALGNRLSEQVDGNVTGASINRLNQLIGQSAGGKMTFSGTLSRPSSVTINGASANADTSSFYGTANVTTGTNTVAIVANDFNGQVTTNRYQVVVPPSSASYTYDLNGNLTDDGTRTYQWDAKDELTAIIYKVGTGDPNAGNHTDFTYNGSGQRVKIVERTGTAAASGTVISTKQYVFNEERDVNNVTTKRYFSQGEQRVVGGVTTNYFYTRDHLGSIREMLDTGGNIQARYSYDPYGRRSKVSGALDCDYGFTGHYYHATSGYYLSPTRAYDPNAGRWISRDPSGEGSGLNLYAYCGGNPVCNTDSSGLCMDSLSYLYDHPIYDNPLSPLYDPYYHPENFTGGPDPFLVYFGLLFPGSYILKLLKLFADSPETNELHRPYIRNWVRDIVQAQAPKAADGRFIDPNTGLPTDEPVLGHQTGLEFWRLKKAAQKEGVSQKEFNDTLNNPEFYQIEDKASNASHEHEQSD